ncbi:MAG: VWA domain-containing protein [Vicinamibacterales bacterium]|nr:VWA domain-containing protein [Vicinamibacterales bacterium]
MAPPLFSSSGLARRRAALGVALLALVAGDTRMAGQQFRASTELVLVDVVATRADGNLARDLTVDDFEIFEDGRPQVVRQFQVVDLERASERSPDPPGVFSNTAEPGAVFAMVVDEMMIDARHTPYVRRWARRFVDEHVQPQDYLAVVRSGADSGLMLTTDHALVTPVIAQASGRRGGGDAASITGAETEEVPMPGSDTPVLADFSDLALLEVGGEARIQAEQSLVMLQRVVEYLAPIPGRRKAVLLFSQGISFDIEALANDQTARSFDPMRRLLAAAREGNVAIYTIDPRGLRGSTEPSIAETPLPVTGDPGVDGLRDLATATGGRAVVSTNEINESYERITRENRFYYLLGYEPVSSGTSTRARRIEVRTRAAGVDLLHRRAYAPRSPATALPARSLVASPLPGGGVPVVLAPTLFPDPSGGASVAVPFELGSGLTDGTEVAYSLVAIDGRGRQAAGTKGTLQAAGGVARGLQRMTLAPGRYQVRLVAEIGALVQEGVAFANLEVPRPGADMAMCGGFMFVQSEGGQVRPNVTRVFNASHPIMVATVVSARSLPEGVPMAFGVTAPGSDTSLVFEVERPRQISNGLWRFEIALPAPLPPGELELVLLAGEQPLPGCRAELRIQ